MLISHFVAETCIFQFPTCLLAKFVHDKPVVNPKMHILARKQDITIASFLGYHMLS